jgi:hypothetical protein
VNSKLRTLFCMFILETCNVTIVMFFYCRILFFLEDLFCGWNPIQCDFFKFDSVGHQFSSSWTVFEPREKDLLIGKYGVFFLEWHRILGCITTWKIKQGTWFIYFFKLVNTQINCTPNSGSFIHSFIHWGYCMIPIQQSCDAVTMHLQNHRNFSNISGAKLSQVNES